MSKPAYRPWIGVDLDGTLAYYDGWKGNLHIGLPVPKMAARVIQWIVEGKDVRIFTARVGRASIQNNLGDGEIFYEEELKIEKAIQDWTEKFLGKRLPVTAEKDFAMVELWDDRCVQVKTNTGESLAERCAAIHS
jgi:hypothetical protein